jgi:hypothetical protein
MNPLCEFPLQISSGGEVLWYCGSYVSMNSDLYAWSEGFDEAKCNIPSFRTNRDIEGRKQSHFITKNTSRTKKTITKHHAEVYHLGTRSRSYEEKAFHKKRVD